MSRTLAKGGMMHHCNTFSYMVHKIHFVKQPTLLYHFTWMKFKERKKFQLMLAAFTVLVDIG